MLGTKATEEAARRATEEAARRVRALTQNMRAGGWLNPRQWSPNRVGEVLRGTVLRTVAEVDPWTELTDPLAGTTVYAPEPTWSTAPKVVVAPEDGTDPVIVEDVRFLGHHPAPGDVAHIEVVDDEPIILVGAFVASDLAEEEVPSQWNI